MRNQKIKKDSKCCMCGYEFKNFYETNNPFPYPTELFLDNNSSRCCAKCNYTVIALRLNKEITAEISKFAKTIVYDKDQKKEFNSFCFSNLGNQIYTKIEEAKRNSRA